MLVLDEPTRALDPVGSLEIRRLIKERVANQRRTVLIATNIMAEAELLCDRLAFINHGKVEMTGSIEEMRYLIETEDVYEIVVSNFPGDYLNDLRRIEGVDSVGIEPAEANRQLITLGVQRGAPVVPDAVRAIVATGADVWACSRREMSVDEMFATLARRAPSARAREAVPA